MTTNSISGLSHDGNDRSARLGQDGGGALLEKTLGKRGTERARRSFVAYQSHQVAIHSVFSTE
jgi:hypothetical protein